MNTDSQVTEEAVVTPDKQIASSFNEELEKVGIDPKTGQDKIETANDVTAKSDPRTATQVQKDTQVEKNEDDIPDEILTGTKKERVEDVDPFKAEPPQELKGKSREHFKNLQVQAGQKITAFQTENARLAAEIAELKKNGSAPENLTKELEQLRKDREELNAELERVAVERSPGFKQKYLSREQSLKAQAVKVLKVTGVDESLFEQAINSSDKVKFELLNSDQLNEGQRSALSSLLVQYDMLQDEKAAALANSSEFAKEAQAQEEKRQQAQLAAREQQENQIFETIGKKVSAEFEPFIEVEGNEAWNAQVRENREKAKNFFAGKASLEELAEIAHYGIGAKSLHKMFRKVQDRNRELVAENTKLKGSNPSINGHHEQKAAPVNESREDRLKRVFNEEMEAVNQG